LREDRLIGGLVVNRKQPGEFAPEVIALLRTFATQSALAIQNARLFLEIADKSRQLEAASRHKSEFLANMSHELRTPLNAVIGFSEVLVQRMFGELNDKQEEYLKDIYASGQHLLSLINDILDLAKIEAGKLELEQQEFRLHAIMEKLAVLFAQRAAEKGVELVLSAPAHLPQVVVGDAVRLEQILVNLTSNALKFTERGEVEVGVLQESSAPGRAVLRFTVRDTGIGLTEEQSERLFKPFSQADDSTTRRYGGTGLGLNISKQLVDRMGGRIGVNSTPGGGSTFWLTVPFDIPEQHAPQVDSVVPSKLAGLRTLVVDDSATVRKVYAGMLRSLGLAPEIVASGEEALRKFSEGHYELVLMDWRMPGMDGMETARA
ncbi:MAG: ATP-binding protein, partial [Nevskiales bacterium]